jgi:serine/threonine protein kinase/Tol biopolymer transport system component
MSPPQTIAHYRILSKLGEGGMGAVYRATDTKLSREVAIKVLPDALANDPDYLARFQREALVLASLNHPNIAVIHGIEENALVMELVPGPTLEEMIAAGPMPLDEALPIARQIAEALEAAHEKGVIHRDLKPANVKVTPEGVVKVLDFGLAKTGDSASNASAANSPTLTMSATRAGMIMGTAAYMSPEQAKGKAVDRRADIWAFGVVLREMLTGQRMYAGDTVAEILASVLKDSPDLNALPAPTPPVIRELLRRCLEKDPRRRLRDIGEARIQIEDYLAHPESPAPPAAAAKPRRAWPYAVFCGTVLLLAGSVIYWQRRTPAPDSPTSRFLIPPPAGYRYTGGAVSPDGRRIAVVIQGPGPRQIWIREMDSPQMRMLAGTEGAGNLFWAPDSRSLGFSATPLIKRVDIGSGQVQAICDSPGTVAGATWNADGVIVASVFNQNLVRVAASGGTPQPILTGRPELKNLVLWFPHFLPDGHRFLFTADGDPGRDGIYLGSLEGKEPVRRILPFASGAVFAPEPGLQTGHIFFRAQGALMAVRFDAGKGEVSGGPFAVHQHAGPSTARLPVSSSVPARVIAWLELSASQNNLAEIVALDRSGRRLFRVDTGSAGGHPELSPDGARLISERQESSVLNFNLWTFDLNRKVASRLAFGAGTQGPAAWLPDGQRLIFAGTVNGIQGLFTAPADGSKAPEKILQGIFHHLHVTPDGKIAAFEVGGVGSNAGHEIQWLPLQGGALPETLVNATAAVGNPQFSPDGRWFSYSSAESGVRQVYVESFPRGNGRWQVSNAGGTVSRWRRDGRELIYYDEAAHNVWSVAVTPRGSTLELGTPVKLFDVRFLNGYFAITHDAQRFYANVAQEVQGERTPEAEPLTVVLDWRGAAKQ